MVARVVSVLRASCAVCGIVCVLYASPSKHAQGLGKGIGAGCWLAVCFVGGAKAALSLALAGSLALFFFSLFVYVWVVLVPYELSMSTPVLVYSLRF